jgi:protein-disulfide isomerase
MSSEQKISSLLCGLLSFMGLWLAALTLFVAWSYISSNGATAAAISFDKSKQPTLGDPNAPVEVVIFDEPKCPYCKQFQDDIFTKLKENYIDTKKITYTTYIVSFLPNSMPAAKALLCVYHQDEGRGNPGLFYEYLTYMYAHQPEEQKNWATTSFLIDMAKNASAQIDTAKLEKCIENSSGDLAKQNTEYGISLTKEFSTPALYIDGVPVPAVSYEGISKYIDAQLAKKNSGK